MQMSRVHHFELERSLVMKRGIHTTISSLLLELATSISSFCALSTQAKEVRTRKSGEPARRTMPRMCETFWNAAYLQDLG
ncbi:hypothetical protein PoB_006546200 [Plakobranchus ocellatus]|uniref:Uncharacterized protein n=1 Tax=Plakobranchus ocellatus TaxID=259542 RepID=A0AAV4D435_9GAST|nr:hypothetical protein PoB_006546200 [Plakobranchus ocellatus]